MTTIDSQTLKPMYSMMNDLTVTLKEDQQSEEKALEKLAGLILKVKYDCIFRESEINRKCILPSGDTNKACIKCLTDWAK